MQWIQFPGKWLRLLIAVVGRLLDNVRFSGKLSEWLRKSISMLRERISDDIYVFSSRMYAQETAGAIITKAGVILIDTLFYPEETLAIKQFIEERLGQEVRYLINTHYHADHTQGTFLFPNAHVVAHSRCMQLLDTIGRDGLTQTKEQMAGFEDVRIVLPDLTFEQGHLDIHLGGTSVRLLHMPGHSLDLVGVWLMQEGILFASDNMMPVPTLFDGDFENLQQSLKQMLKMDLECVVQGHGEVILRGEVNTVLESNLAYLDAIKQRVGEAVNNGVNEEGLEEITIESCGKSRIPLNGLVSDLHHANLLYLYHSLRNGG